MGFSHYYICIDLLYDCRILNACKKSEVQPAFPKTSFKIHVKGWKIRDIQESNLGFNIYCSMQ